MNVHGKVVKKYLHPVDVIDVIEIDKNKLLILDFFNQLHVVYIGEEEKTGEAIHQTVFKQRPLVFPEGFNQGFGFVALHEVGNEVFISGDFNLFKFDKMGEMIVPETELTASLTDRRVYQRIFPMADNNKLLVSNSRLQIADLHHDGYKIDSLVVSNIADNSVNTLLSVDGDKYLIGGGKGLNVLWMDREINPNHHKLTTRIGSTVLNRTYRIYNGIKEADMPPLKIPYGDNDFRFEFSSSDLRTPSLTQYSYKLEPLEREWSFWNREHTKDYTRLREGTYTFNVRAMSNTGVIGTIDTFTFTILPPWYRTWWAYLLYVAAFVSLIYSVHKYRVNKLLEVERTRIKIARDLHDEIGSNLGSIALISEMLQRKRQLNEPDQAKLEMIGKTSREMAESLREIVWFVNPENDDTADFISKLKELTERMLVKHSHTFNVDPSVMGIAFKMDERRNIYLILKEAFHNIIKHAEADKVEIVIDKRAGIGILIKITDNGKGFDGKPKDGGNGIRNMQSRAGQIGGEIAIGPSVNGGTEISLFIR